MKGSLCPLGYTEAQHWQDGCYSCPGKRPLCNYGHTKEDHDRVGACERPGAGTVYGIRPHLPISAAHLEASMTFRMTAINRPAMELIFDLCLKCKERRQNCTCHERGYN